MILKGKTQKGKNRIRELGERWVILQEKETVMFSPERGPWLLICPVNEVDEPAPKNMRWLHKSQDVDFEIVT